MEAIYTVPEYGAMRRHRWGVVLIGLRLFTGIDCNLLARKLQIPESTLRSYVRELMGRELVKKDKSWPRKYSLTTTGRIAAKNLIDSKEKRCGHSPGRCKCGEPLILEVETRAGKCLMCSEVDA